MTLNELERLISNLLRVGVVEEVDTEKMVCRVRTGDILTDWIRWGADRAGAGRSWWAPVAGEQVIIGAVNGELTTAFVLCSLYSDKNSAPIHSAQAMHKTFSDGAVIEYEPATGTLKATGIKTALIDAGESITATSPVVVVNAEENIRLVTPTVICSDNLTCATLNVMQGGEMSGSFEHTGGSFSSNGVVIHEHDHGGVERGGSWTDGIK
ncbi:phage baseplate assembly protein V [Morganella morganii subsp. sibonii]